MDCSIVLKECDIRVSVPCRIDLGGTLDISTFFLPMGHLAPSTFNIALDMRTRVRLSVWEKGYIKVCSRGFEPAEFKAGSACFNHPLGLIFAIAAYFDASGICIDIDSSSPPRSALGGSSAAAVALVSAFLKLESMRTQDLHGTETPDWYNGVSGKFPDTDSGISLKSKNFFAAYASILAHYIEAGVAGVPCGFQDQLAAAYGGINLWHWIMGEQGPSFIREEIFPGFGSVINGKESKGIQNAYEVDDNKRRSGRQCNDFAFSENSDKEVEKTNNKSSEKFHKSIKTKDVEKLEKLREFNNNILIAYCGIPHASKDINKRWVDEFLSGKNRDKWEEICKITLEFSESVKSGDFLSAKDIMNRETDIRLDMTPDVLDGTGMELFRTAREYGCGARFTGAGGGGCLWAIGESDDIMRLKKKWEILLACKEQALLLDTRIDIDGILFDK